VRKRAIATAKEEGTLAAAARKIDMAVFVEVTGHEFEDSAAPSIDPAQVEVLR